MNVLPGDTLTILGERGKVYMRGRKPKVGLPSAGILSHVASDRQEYNTEIKNQSPSFMGGGNNHFSSWVNDHLRYPPESQKIGSQGKVVLSFTLETDGRMGSVYVLQTSGDRALDREAVRVVSSSPAWSPGIKDGRPVRVTYAFPVIFQLR
jgi:TonB family protein